MSNTLADDRIKRLKQTLDEKIQGSASITIVPHTRADFDAIGSAIALYILALRRKKEVNILIDDNYDELDSGVQIILKEIITKGFSIINYFEYKKKFANKDNLLILTDTSQKSLIPLEEEIISDKIDKKKIMIIDHHPFGKNTIEATDKFISADYSSACEIITKMLFLSRTKFSNEIATYLYAGIWLDSNRLTKKGAINETHKWAGRLVENNADIDKVNDLFIEDYNNNQKIQELVSNRMTIFGYTIAYLIGEDSKKYCSEDLAKAADACLKYRVDASFAVGDIGNNTVSISARSKGSINVGEIMEEFNGGGSIVSAAAKVNDEIPSIVGKKLIKALKPSFYVDKES